MEFDEKTGRKKNEHEFEKDIVASIYDSEGKYYLISRDKKIFLKKNTGELLEIIDDNMAKSILQLFKPGEIDVI